MFFSLKIIKWYKLKKRDLPWRNTKNPYYIWLSEIILQQTRVEQGRPYFEKFIQNYPNVFALANASEEAILRDWQGLGYYSRARNLHAAAKSIVTDFYGIFPDSYEKIRHLRGVGDYTAAAIASFAFDIPVPVIDGNVNRVISRYFGIDAPIDTKEGKNIISACLHEVFDEKQPALFNQAIMEFGALQCKPLAPNCADCVLNERCVAFARHTVTQLPIKIKKTKIKPRFFYFFIFQSTQFTWIEQRKNKDIWQQLFQFPLVAAEKPLTPQEACTALSNQYSDLFPIQPFLVSDEMKHILSHQHLFCRFIHIVVPDDTHLPFLKVSQSALTQYGFPIVLIKYMQQLGWVSNS